MKSIEFKELVFPNNTYHSFGTYGRIYKCLYQNDIFAYKSFNNNNFLNGKKNKLNAISKIQNPYLLVPSFWVKNNFIIDNYLAKFCFGKDLDSYADYDIKYKIKLLKSGKDAVKEMHKSGIIHSDLIGSNIMIENNEARIIDFDNCTFNKFKTNPLESNDLSSEFIKEFGIIPEVDIYLYNLLTFSIINECGLYQVREKIQKEKYKYLDGNKEAIKICKKMKLDNTLPTKDFLIDAIDEVKFSI